MKKLSSLLILLIVLASCANDVKESTANNQEKWVLIEMHGSTPNSKTTGDNMEWQEFYVLNSNGTFKKSRKKNGISNEISGVYKVVDSINPNMLELTYNNASEIIGNCTSDLKEYMNFKSETVFSSTWQQCDGPSLKYEKLK